MDRTTQILEKLIERTQEGKVSWHTTVDPNGFLTTLDTISVIVSSSQPLEYRVEIQNQDGLPVMIQETPDRLLKGLVRQEDEQHLSQLLGRLFGLARRSALKVDSTLEELVSHLDAIR